MRNLERVILKAQKNVTNILLNAFTKQRKKHSDRKNLRNKTKPFYCRNEETEQLVKEKRKIFEMD